MKKVRFRCKICGEEFEVKVIERDEANDPNIPSSPVRCPKCSNTQIEEIKKYYWGNIDF